MFRDYYAGLWFDSGFLHSGRLRLGLFRLGLFHLGKVRGAPKFSKNSNFFVELASFPGKLRKRKFKKILGRKLNLRNWAPVKG